jgi:histidine ammonia-lyase
VVGIELLAAAQGIEFHRPLKTSIVLEAAVEQLRGRVPHYGEDHYFAPDIERAADLVRAGACRPLVEDLALG